jgi:UDP-GlcNAc:undecaprenyl-phosphate/decaprenyl-phosphate GlcNAc-1-phosphate transferase
MIVYLAPLVASALLGLALTRLITSGSLAIGLVDAPGGRKVHSASVPRVGGLAIALAAATTLVAMAWASNRGYISAPSLAPITPILIGAGCVFAVGLMDDIRSLPAAPKLLIQTLAAGFPLASGLLIERVTIGDQTWQLGIFAWPVTLVWIVGLTNAFNLIDGLDGLGAGIAAIAGTTCLTILISRGHAAEALLLAALVGGALGFLVFNFPPASIFLGDGGSLAFGFVLATTAIAGWQKGATALAAGVPLLIFALPIADASSALIRRAHPGSDGTSLLHLLRRLAQPDRAHIHHRLAALGWSTRRTVLLLYAVTILLSALALASADLQMNGHP